MNQNMAITPRVSNRPLLYKGMLSLLLFTVGLTTLLILQEAKALAPINPPPTTKHFSSSQQSQCSFPLSHSWVTTTTVESKSRIIISVRSAKKDDTYDDGEDEIMDDETLLKTVSKEKLLDLCRQVNLQVSKKATKADLLKQLRQHALDRMEKERARKISLAKRVEEGFGDDPKERYEIVGDDSGGNDDDDDDDDFFVYYAASDDIVKNETEKNNNGKKQDPSSIKSASTTTATTMPAYLTQASVTAPPMPPDLKSNEDGERVVTVYSTTEQNDLTGVAAAQPGGTNVDPLQQSSRSGLLDFGSGGSQTQPWDVEAAHQKTRATNEEVAKATETVMELVQLLLAMSGAPLFVHLAEDLEQLASYDIPKEFIGLDPSKVPPHLLSSASKALRTGRGQVLEEVLRQFEIQAIGQDGMAGDNRDRGGGHYREVSKVRALLEGFRRAEVRKIARETTTLLLDKLVEEGVQGLDLTLATMTRSTDDTSEHGGELNDSLLDYLNDAIRQQERKVDQLLAQQAADRRIPIQFEEEGPDDHDHLRDPTLQDSNNNNNNNNGVEEIDQLWNVTTENGERVESIDPNDRRVKQALGRELEKEEEEQALLAAARADIPEAPSEKLLLLLTLLRERLNAEGAFAPDEKGRNLRLLAYCLHTPSPLEREQLLSRDLGRSLDRMDSFIELVESSIEYGESTSHQLQPAKTKRPLNLKLLRSILTTAKDMRKQQAWKASKVW